MKKVLLLAVFAIAVAMLFSSCRGKTHEITEEPETFGLELISEGKEYKLISVSQFNGEVIIPEIINGITVTAIGGEAFANCTGVKKITIPKSVTFIEEGVFANCPNLLYISVPFIGQSRTEPKKFSFFFSPLKNELITFFSVIVSDAPLISNAAFKDNPYLISISFGNSLTEIEESAFENCSKLGSVSFGKGLEKINGSAFKDCKNLRNIEISDSLKSIGTEAFWGCSFNNIYLPDTLTDIGIGAFNSCSYLTKITIPSNVTEIKDSTFFYCMNLHEVNFPDTLISIGNNAFAFSTKLTNITIPSSVIEIGENVFEECVKLVQITNLSQVDLSPSDSSQEIRTSTEVPFTGFLSVDENGLETYSIGGRNYIINYHGNQIKLDLTNTNCNAIYKFALLFSTVEEITIAENIIYLDAYALYSMNLKTVYIDMPFESANDWDKDWNTGCDAEIIWKS